tara:strand:+ start:1647 stop:1940 length:294 start_codon:yes stop_codon:yes gene_type:complete
MLVLLVGHGVVRGLFDVGEALLDCDFTVVCDEAVLGLAFHEEESGAFVEQARHGVDDFVVGWLEGFVDEGALGVPGGVECGLDLLEAGADCCDEVFG